VLQGLLSAQLASERCHRQIKPRAKLNK